MMEFLAEFTLTKEGLGMTNSNETILHFVQGDRNNETIPHSVRNDRKTMRALSTLLSLSLILATSFTGNKVTSDSNKYLPELTLKDMNGKQVSVSEYGKNGKLTVVCFWATWCKPCIKELSNLAEHYDEWAKNYNVQILAVSVDDSKTSMRVPSVVKSKKWKFDILLDPNEDLKRALGVSSSPYSLLADKNGKIIYEHEGYVEGDEYGLEEEIKKAFVTDTSQ